MIGVASIRVAACAALCLAGLGIASAEDVTGTACTARNSGSISIGGVAVKALGGAVDVRYRLCNFDPATYFDVYVAVQLPGGDLLFLSSSGDFFGAPSFTPIGQQARPAAYRNNTLIPDMEGSVLSMFAMPLDLPTGAYTFYAVPVSKGGNVMNPSEWTGNLASAVFTLKAPIPDLAVPTGLDPGSASSPGPELENSMPILSWGAVAGATSFELSVTDIDSGAVVLSTAVTGTSYWASLLPLGKYQWKVAACNATGCSGASAALNFQAPVLGCANM